MPPGRNSFDEASLGKPALGRRPRVFYQSGVFLLAKLCGKKTQIWEIIRRRLA
jgi:hypothetical protein